MTSQVPPAGPRSQSFPAAELERRFYAFVIDRLIIWGLYAVAAVAGWLVLGRDGVWTIVAIVVGLALVSVVVTGTMTGTLGATPGKRAVGLRVVHQGTGTPLGAGPGIVRALIVGLSALPTFGFGLATLAWTALADPRGQRRGWHDQVSASVVVDLRPPVDVAEQAQETPRQVVNLTALRLVPVPVQPAPVVERPNRPAVASRASAAPVAPSPEASQQAMQQPQARPTGPPAPPRPSAEQPVQPIASPRSAPDPGRTVARGGVAAPEVSSQVSSQVRGPRWRVVFDTGDGFVVEGLALVGRRPEPRSGEQVRHVVPLPSTDMSLSKTHAQFGIAPDGSLVVMDRGSTNGSLLLRQGVTRELTAGKPATLVAGDQVRFGDREMTVLRDA